MAPLSGGMAQIRHVKPRRRVAAACSVIALGGCGGSTPSSTEAAKPVDRAALAQRSGQMVISSVDGASAGRRLLARVRAGSIGGVILFGPNIRSVGQVRAMVDRLQRAASAGGRPPLLVLVDQEGGQVRRFGSLPPTTSPALMGTAARAQGRATAAGLRRAGVNVDLAPVADVPSVPGNFLGDRAFGTSVGAVRTRACAFASGLAAGGVAPTLKHFPGLGAAPGNTDFASATVRLSRGALRRAYAPYRACGNKGLVMVSSAAYTALPSRLPAVLEPATYRRELREIAGFRGPAISDDLVAAALRPYPDAGVRAAAAGLDLLLYGGTERTAAHASAQLSRAVRSGRVPASRVTEALRRIAALRSSL
jgi:beta-N-acetylhexosaminidase